MKRHGILNAGLNDAIAQAGHGDLLLVCDAGYPIPRDGWRVDLAIKPDLPDLRTILDLVGDEYIAEEIVIAEEMIAHNPPLHAWVQERFAGIPIQLIPHTKMLADISRQAKAIIRTGAFEPWGNVGLISGVDAPKWFAKPGTIVSDSYADRVKEDQ